MELKDVSGWDNFIIGSSEFAFDLNTIADFMKPLVNIADGLSTLLGMFN